MKFENNMFRCLEVVPEDLAKNDSEILKIKELRSSVEILEAKIKELTELKDKEEQKLEEFLISLIGAVEGIEIYESPGNVIVCDCMDMIFMYDGKQWVIYRK